jgi:peptidoglycan/LPS O-acetylase OafA/YrhL
MLAMLAPKAARAEDLDGVRGIAVLIVLVSHTAGRDQALAQTLDFAGIGHVGVYLFFVLSAFLLGMGMLDRGVTRESVKAFFVRRLFRILPLYYLTLLLVFAYQLFLGRYNDWYLHISNGFGGFLQHLALYRGDGVFWSVVVEMQFYLVVPLFAWFLLRHRRRALVVLIGLAVVNECLYVAKFFAPQFPNPLEYLTPNTRGEGTYLGLFVGGMVAAYVARFHEGDLMRQVRRFHVAALLSFAFVCVLTVALISRNFLGLEQPFYEFRFLSPIYSLVFSAFLLSVYMGNPWTGWLRFAPFRFLGITAFSVYLLHFAVIALVDFTDWSGPVKLLASVTGIVVVASVTYLAIERPFVRISYRLTGGASLKAGGLSAVIDGQSPKSSPA